MVKFPFAVKTLVPTGVHWLNGRPMPVLASTQYVAPDCPPIPPSNRLAPERVIVAMLRDCDPVRLISSKPRNPQSSRNPNSSTALGPVAGTEKLQVGPTEAWNVLCVEDDIPVP